MKTEKFRKKRKEHQDEERSWKAFSDTDDATSRMSLMQLGQQTKKIMGGKWKNSRPPYKNESRTFSDFYEENRYDYGMYEGNRSYHSRDDGNRPYFVGKDFTDKRNVDWKSRSIDRCSLHHIDPYTDDGQGWYRDRYYDNRRRHDRERDCYDMRLFESAPYRSDTRGYDRYYTNRRGHDQYDKYRVDDRYNDRYDPDERRDDRTDDRWYTRYDKYINEMHRHHTSHDRRDDKADRYKYQNNRDWKRPAGEVSRSYGEYSPVSKRSRSASESDTDKMKYDRDYPALPNAATRWADMSTDGSTREASPLTRRSASPPPRRRAREDTPPPAHRQTSPPRRLSRSSAPKRNGMSSEEYAEL